MDRLLPVAFEEKNRLVGQFFDEAHRYEYYPDGL